MDNEIKEYCKYCRFYGVLGCKSTLICNDGNRFFNPNIANEEQGMTLVYDDESGTWGEAPEVYGTIECATKEDYEYAKKAIKGYKELEAKHWDECRQIAHYDDEIKRLEAADVQPIKHGRWEYYKNNGIFDTHRCTLCGEKYEMYMDIEPTTIYKYCPNCGARMIKDGEQNG